MRGPGARDYVLTVGVAEVLLVNGSGWANARDPRSRRAVEGGRKKYEVRYLEHQASVLRNTTPCG